MGDFFGLLRIYERYCDNEVPKEVKKIGNFRVGQFFLKFLKCSPGTCGSFDTTERRIFDTISVIIKLSLAKQSTYNVYLRSLLYTYSILHYSILFLDHLTGFKYKLELRFEWCAIFGSLYFGLENLYSPLESRIDEKLNIY